VNPMIGSGMQQGRRVEEENRRGGEKPRGRHAGRELAFPPRRKRARAETRGPGRRQRRTRTQPGVGLRDLVRWRGDLWTTPREETRLCGRVARTETRRESRRQGQEGRACHYESSACGPVEVLEGRDAATHPKAEEGSSERPGSRDFDRSSSPRRWHLQMRRCGADHIPASPRSEERERDRGASARRDRGRDISSAGSVLRHPIREPRGERRRWNRKEPPAPEGQVNHIPVRRFAVVAP